MSDVFCKVFRHGGWGSVGEKPAAQNHRHFCLCWYYRTGFTASLGPVLSSRRRVGVEASHFYRLKEKDKAVLFATSAGTCTLDSAKSSHHLKSLLWQAKTINCTPKLFKGAILFYSWAVSGVLSSPVMFLGASSRTLQIYVTLSHELQHKAGDFFFSLQVSITLVSQSEDLFWSNSKILSWSVKGRFGCLGDESKSFQVMWGADYALDEPFPSQSSLGPRPSQNAAFCNMWQ